MISRTEADLRQRCTSRLLPQEPVDWNRSDEDMNERSRLLPLNVKPKPAAVLVPIITRPQGLSVLLTQRTETLSNHAGQIAFPGGRIDQGETAVAAALREAREEVSLASEYVEPLGFLDGYLTVTGYVVKPVVALVSEGHTVSRQQSEVADVFEVPFDFLMDKGNLRIDSRDFKGVQRRYYVFPFGERYIWGATAGMIKSLYDRLFAPD